MPRRVVADACVLVKWFVPEDFSEEALRLMGDHLRGVVSVVAPSFAVLEFVNALRKYVVRSVLSEDDVREAVRLLERAEVEYVSVGFDVLREALECALEWGVTVYDACYIVLARRFGVEVYTADEKLLRGPGGRE
ncbi:MAG: VapC toxin family PIN domain ribonuclease, partial [Deltaproteobacteria bacterium]